MAGAPTIYRRCSAPRCRAVEEVSYLGKPLCGKHWIKLCDEHERAEQAALAKRTEGRTDAN